MCIPRGKQALDAKDKSTILAWYPIDEPEDQKVTPEQVRADYDAIRAADPDRPIGICHHNLEMTKKFKDRTFSDCFMPYEVHVYQWGETPAM